MVEIFSDNINSSRTLTAIKEAVIQTLSLSQRFFNDLANYFSSYASKQCRHIGYFPKVIPYESSESVAGLSSGKSLFALKLEQEFTSTPFVKAKRSAIENPHQKPT